MEKIVIVGRVGNDAVERKHNGKTVLSFSVATDSKDKNGNQFTNWFDCAFWSSKPTKLKDYLTKGKLVYVEGYPKAKSYTDKNGETHGQISIKVNKVELLANPSK